MAADDVRDAIAGLLTDNAREALAALDAPPIDPDSLEEYLARLRFACPAYLPFATYDGSMIAIHLWPGRAVEQSPIYYLPHDEQSARFLCGALADLPVGMWLWVARYFKERKEELESALNRLRAEIPNAREIPPQLWQILDTAPEFEPTWWSADATPETRQAWKISAVDHPFVDVPSLDGVEEPADAIPILESYLNSHRDAAPEIAAALLAAQREAGEPRDLKLVLRVLSAEAQRGGSTVFEGEWRSTGDGLAEWDSTLRCIEAPGETLRGTPFEPLATAPDTYTGTAAEGPGRLIETAARWHAAGDVNTELRQLRNAAWVQALTEGEVSSDLCAALAESADRVASGALAAALARACASTPTSAA
jgi:hypothetical protein